jgi:parvulin-like peptidyl-prolyl isomerase
MVVRICFLLIIICCSQYAQQEEKVVATVGDYKIYESEFSERFDFSTHPNLLQKGDKFSAKHEFLKQLIAEKLLSLEAQEKGYDQAESFSDIFTHLQNMFIRDALYMLEIKNKLSFAKDEIDEGIGRISRILKIKFLYSKNPEEMEYLYLQLKAGASFDSLISLRPEAKVNQPMETTFGKMNKAVEDSIYKLKVGEYTGPIEYNRSYYIMKLEDVVPNTELNGYGMTLEEVTRTVEARAEYKRFNDFFYNFFKEYKITTDGEVIEGLVKSFVLKFKTKYTYEESEFQKPETNKYYLIGFEIISVLNFLKSDLKEKEFIKLPHKEIKLKYFLNQLSQEGLVVKDTSEQSIRATLSSYVRKFIEDELLAIEGKRKGLNKSYEVEKYVNMWRDAYLSKMLMAGMFDSIKVSEEEAYSIYQQNDWKNEPPELVNIAEILTDSLEVVEFVLNELSHGKDIKDLAVKYTKRDSLKNRKGEFGFFPVTSHGEIGKAASRMKIGEIYGPVKLDEGYSVFQLLDRKADTTIFSKSYNEVKDQIITHITLKKFEKYVNEYNASLAQKYGLKVYEEVLNEIENLNMNLVVVRYMGFGGEIFAVPYTEQFSGWYDIWQKNNATIQ